jgi:hypothetical protein
VVTKDGWLGEKTKRLYTVAGAAHVCEIALCFPFNRRHDYVSEHQNSGILAFNCLEDKEHFEKCHCNLGMNRLLQIHMSTKTLLRLRAIAIAN